MDQVNIRSRLTELFKKYRYAVLIVLLGVVLLCLPSGQNDAKETAVPMDREETVEPDLEQLLSEILSQIKGAGRVEVLLTEAKGIETLYQSDANIGADTDRQDTVIVSDADRTQNGLIRQIIPPIYRGAIVVCQGADSPSVRLAIVEAVSSVTGLGTDHITVLKMK